jgi:hypothetical protein
LLQGIEERALGLIRGRISEFLAGRAAVPEVSADEQGFLLLDDEVENRALGRIGRAGRLAVAEAIRDRAFVDPASGVDAGLRSGPAGLRCMTGGAGLIEADRQVLVEEDRLAQGLHVGQTVREAAAGADEKSHEGRKSGV